MSTPDYLKVSDSEVLSNSWGTLTRHRIEYRRRDGDWQEQVREVYERDMEQPACSTIRNAIACC